MRNFIWLSAWVASLVIWNVFGEKVTGGQFFVLLVVTLISSYKAVPLILWFVLENPILKFIYASIAVIGVGVAALILVFGSETSQPMGYFIGVIGIIALLIFKWRESLSFYIGYRLGQSAVRMARGSDHER